MAEVHPSAVTPTSTGAYKWAGFVVFDTAGGGQVDELILENFLFGKRDDLDYVRVQVPAEWNGEQFAALVTTLDARAVVDTSGAAPVFYTADDATEGLRAVRLIVTDSAGGGPHTHRIFVEYGVEHSVDK